MHWDLGDSRELSKALGFGSQWGTRVRHWDMGDSGELR